MAVFRGRRRKKPLSFRSAFFISLAIFLAVSLQTFVYIEKRLEPAVLAIAKTKVEQMAADAINEAISKQITEGTDFKNLVYFQKDGDGKIKALMFNYNEQSRIVGAAMAKVSNTLKALEQVSLEIPLGQALDSNILAMVGPVVPISMVPMGAVEVNLIPKIQEAGINMVLISVYIDIQAKVQMVIPFTTEPTIVRSEIPITQAIVVGDVPDFYFKGSGNPEENNAPVLPPIQFNNGVSN